MRKSMDRTTRDVVCAPTSDVRNPVVTEFGRQARRLPACRSTPGGDSGAFDSRPEPRSGDCRRISRFTTRPRGYLPGARFLRSDTRH